MQHKQNSQFAFKPVSCVHLTNELQLELYVAAFTGMLAWYCVHSSSDMFVLEGGVIEQCL